MSVITFENQIEAQDALKADSICRAIGRTLKKHYPGRDWYVDVTIQGGAAKVMSPSISMRHGFVIHIHDKTIDQIERMAVKAGGQILEMFRLSRERGAQGGEESLLRDARGEVIQAATGL